MASVSFMKRMYSEIYKLKHTPILLMHIMLPIAVSAAFAVYYRFSRMGAVQAADFYFQVLGTAYPLVIAIICGMSAEQEKDAGSCYAWYASARRRWVPYLSKTAALIGMSSISVLGAVILYAAAGGSGMGAEKLTVYVYAKLFLMLWGGGMLLYFFHLILSVFFSKTVSVGAGIAEVLISALMLTGLGEGIWMWIPCAWGSRLTGSYLGMISASDPVRADLLSTDVSTGILSCVIISAAGILIFVWLSAKYEGSKDRTE